MDSRNIRYTPCQVSLLNQLRMLWEQHIHWTRSFIISTAADLVNAAKKNDTKAMNAARNKWYQNADEIAAFLAGINPHWSKDIWQDFLFDHLEMTEQEVALRLAGKYAKDVKIYDMIEIEALKMADYMFHGFISNFDYC